MLKLKIDRSWEPQDFIEVMGSLESMYCKIALRRSRSSRMTFDDFEDFLFLPGRGSTSFGEASFLDEVNKRIVDHSRLTVPGPERLIVRRVEFASPGGIDLLGIGKACQAIADAIANMKRYYDDRHLRRERDHQAAIETDRQRIGLDIEHENLRALQISNARDALRLRSEYPEEDELLISLLVKDQDMLAERIAEGKIVDAHNETSES